MATGSNDRTRLLDAGEPNEEVINEVLPQQTYAPPPPYQMVAGLSSYSNQSTPGQNSTGNYHAPMFGQPPPPTYYCYNPLQSSTGQPTLPGVISALPAGQPVYLIPVNNGQPLMISPYRTSQPQARPIGTQTRNMRPNRGSAPLDSNDDACLKCCCGVFTILIGAAIFFSVVLATMKKNSF